MGLIALGLVFLFSISVGAVRVPVTDLIAALSGPLTGRALDAKWHIIIWNIRMPQALTAVVGGAGLADDAACQRGLVSIQKRPGIK